MELPRMKVSAKKLHTTPIYAISATNADFPRVEAILKLNCTMKLAARGVRRAARGARCVARGARRTVRNARRAAHGQAR